MALPSLEDMDATGSIARALGLVNVHLLDHFILTDTEYFSMRDANRLPINDFKTGELTQKLYDTLTGIQWGKLPDKFNWIHKVK